MELIPEKYKTLIHRSKQLTFFFLNILTVLKAFSTSFVIFVELIFSCQEVSVCSFAVVSQKPEVGLGLWARQCYTDFSTIIIKIWVNAVPKS